MSGDNITQIVLAIITILGTVLTAIMVPWIRSKKTKEELEEIFKWADIFVHFAEELYKATPKAGKEKHELVKEKLKELFGLDDEQCDIIIKALVNKMNNAKKKALE